MSPAALAASFLVGMAVYAGLMAVQGLVNRLTALFGRLAGAWERTRWRRVLPPPSSVELLLLDLAAQLRAGVLLPQALRSAAEDADPRLRPLAIQAAAQADQGDWSGALRRLARSAGMPGDHLAAALEVQRLTGGSLAPIVEQAATSLRRREARRAEIRARTGEARWSAVVMALTPLAMVAYLAWFHGELWTALWRYPGGPAVLTYAGISWVAGMGWVAWLLRQAGRAGEEV